MIAEPRKGEIRNPAIGRLSNEFPPVDLPRLAHVEDNARMKPINEMARKRPNSKPPTIGYPAAILPHKSGRRRRYAQCRCRRLRWLAGTAIPGGDWQNARNLLWHSAVALTVSYRSGSEKKTAKPSLERLKRTAKARDDAGLLGVLLVRWRRITAFLTPRTQDAQQACIEAHGPVGNSVVTTGTTAVISAHEWRKKASRCLLLKAEFTRTTASFSPVRGVRSIWSPKHPCQPSVILHLISVLPRSILAAVLAARYQTGSRHRPRPQSLNAPRKMPKTRVHCGNRNHQGRLVPVGKAPLDCLQPTVGTRPTQLAD